ncbi:hypothetical protein [Bacillus sp. S/N-304-OC-R1]|uniref:hypothetical protein n=1 Tax=Bacillus sp. S/N-304-OC-R1 TaxID=2758034 RepID=UPI001C8E0BDE|nr:hypothetical protein [Bacillus sp. S/N-304-OC-R1]MBY0124495.1 hypothetical protein [Bacillus sp. S/N-304-OC-R1]
MREMNKNIEVINKHLWAVKFSLIPYIPQIDYVSDSNTPAYQEPGRITNDGVMLLNKEYKGYKLFRDLYENTMKKTNRQLKKELFVGNAIKNKTPYQIMCYSMIEVELERREKVRGRGA